MDPNTKHTRAKVADFSLHPERLKDPSSNYANWFYCWKSESARMTYALNGNSSDPKRIKNILAERLGRFMTISPQASEILDCMADTATEIEVRIQTSPWRYELDMRHPDTLEHSGFAYIEEHPLMEAREPCSPPSHGAPIDIICAPSLQEYGRSIYPFTNGSVATFSKFDTPTRSRPLKVDALKNVIC